MEGLKDWPAGELRDDVVVIGVEPLRHFHGRDVAVAVAPCHGEIRIESRTGVLETVRDGSQCDGQIEYMIVEGEITYSDEGEPRIMLELPMPFFQLVRGFVELVFGKLPFPVPFKGFLSSRFRPIRGKPKMCVCIGVSLSTVEVEKSTTPSPQKTAQDT